MSALNPFDCTDEEWTEANRRINGKHWYEATWEDYRIDNLERKRAELFSDIMKSSAGFHERLNEIARAIEDLS